MFIIHDYSLAVFFCVITMLCWGSWANTQKLAGSNWRFELFYWDYVIGILLFSIIAAFTLGSNGEAGRSFLTDLKQADRSNVTSAFLGGIIFNAANILVVAAIDIAGMAVAFPVGIGLALILGVLINYFEKPQGNPFMIFLGVAFIAAAIIANAIAYKRKNAAKKKVSTKGIVLALLGGILMSLFYRFIAVSMDLDNIESPAAGKMTPYTAVFIFSCGVFISNILFNTIIINKPFTGVKTSYNEYFAGKFKLHLFGILGGLIWGIGNSFNLIAAVKAGPAISYGLGQGATLVAALWGVFIWKEFKDAPAGTNKLLATMFLFFIAGLALVIYAGL